jgi:hypothetical protein
VSKGSPGIIKIRRGKMDERMDEKVNESRARRSGLSLHELSQDLQDLGQVTINLAGDLLQLAGVLIRLPFLLLPEETRTHLKNAAREASMAAQAVVEGSISAVSDGVQQFNRSLREGQSATGDEVADAIVIEDDVVEMGDAGSNREVVEPNLQG